MKIPETYDEYLKTPDEILKKIACSEKTKEETERLVSFAMRAIEEFKDKDKLKSAKSNWERYCCG
jgi:hypothetical protein